MELPDGVYRIVCGNGAGMTVEVRSDQVLPIDPGREVRGEILVKDRTFSLDRWDEPLKLRAGLLIRNGQNYPYVARDFITPWPAAPSD